MPKKPQPSPFTSFQILGKKAQAILTKARKIKQDPRSSASSELPPASETEPEILVHLSVRSVLRATLVIFAVVLGVLVLNELRDVIILLLLSAFVAAVIDPGVRSLERWGVPRGLGILVQYCTALLIFVVLLLSLLPIIADQLQQIAVFVSMAVDQFLSDPQIAFPFFKPEINERLTNLTESMLRNLSIHQFTDALQGYSRSLSEVAQGSVRFATRVAGSLLSFFVQTVVVLVLGFFIQMEKEKLRSWVCSFFSHRYRNYLDMKVEAIHRKIGAWARGQLLLALSIGALVFLALSILGIDYALTLAALAAFTEFIPYLGPFIASVPAVLIAITQEGIVWAFVVIGVYYVIQWCENNLLVPLIMKRAVGLSPIAILVAMLVGISFPQVLHPILGILVAVPATTIIGLFLEDWRLSRQKSA
jgi:predicted PurR-regulated permease PerM